MKKKYYITAYWGEGLIFDFGKLDKFYSLTDSEVIALITKYGRASIFPKGNHWILRFENDSGWAYH